MVKVPLITVFIIACLHLVWPVGYTNTGAYAALPAPPGARAIDFVVASKRAVLAGVGRKFSTTPDGAYGTLAGDAYYNGYPFFWVDVSRVLTAQHRALGFVDFMVTTIMEDAPGASVSGPGVAPFTNGWRMMGDDDRRGNQDIRASADGVTCEFLDPRYKGSINFNKSYDTMTILNTQVGYPNFGYSGEYAIIRMEVPRSPVRSYNLFLGYNIIQPWPATYYYGRGVTGFIPAGYPSGDGNSGQALSYQCQVYVPILTNSLIPVVDIKSPNYDGVYVQRFDENLGIMRATTRETRVSSRVPIVFTGENSYMSNISVVKWEWQVDNPGVWTAGGPTYTAFFQTNGVYLVMLRMTSDTGMVVANNGVSNETGSNNQPDFGPAGLPLLVRVTSTPNLSALMECRPNPFIVGQHSKVSLDFTLKEDTSVVLSIYSLDGRMIKNLITSQGQYPVGFWSAAWDGKDERGGWAPEGVYYGVLVTSSGKYLSKIHVLRSN